ncbi:MAG TPA: glycosyltransferase family 4 protein [Chloroflexia bacterium]|nr:glycosyltransferase family 4 protein [Chloroflexia bacterium]
MIKTDAQKKALTLVIHSLSAGGAEKIMSILANYWADEGNRVTLITMADTPPFYALNKRVNFRPLGLAEASKNWLVAMFNSLKRLLILHRAIVVSNPDVVISFMDRQNVLTLLATRGLKLPVVVCEHTEPGRAALSKIWQKLRFWTYPVSSAVVVLTDTAQNFFPANIRKKTFVIPNPAILPDSFEVSKQVSENSSPKIVAMGRLIPLKGFDFLIKAFSSISSQHPDWTLEIWGEGAERSSLEALIKQFGIESQVFLRGFTSRPLEVLKQADFLVLSSHYEGFPTVIWEAMACGLPVVSFDCPSGPGAIIRDGVDGILVPNGNVEALAEAMSNLMYSEAERRRLASRAPEVLERFGLDRVMRRWEALFQEVIPAYNSSDSNIKSLETVA